MKSLEGFTVVECDEIEGSSNVSTLGDDFTVETALEDLEFGFTVTQSTQQVSRISTIDKHCSESNVYQIIICTVYLYVHVIVYM